MVLPHKLSHLAARCINPRLFSYVTEPFRLASIQYSGRPFAENLDVMAVRLTRKLAETIDGIDLSAFRVGDVLHLPWHGAWILIAEGWAEMIERRHRPRGIIAGLRPRSS